jgi:hypothetical protein
MNPRNQILAETLAALRAAGITPRVIQSKHVKIVWTDAQGQQQHVAVARSPGCRNAVRAARATLRRAMRARA